MIYVLFDCAVKLNRSFGAWLRGSSLCFRTIGITWLRCWSIGGHRRFDKYIAGLGWGVKDGQG